MELKTTRFHTFLDEDEAAESVTADLIGFRSHPQKGSFLPISMVRSRYRDDFLLHANLSNGEKTREQLEALAISDISRSLEFLAFCSGYLTARMFMPAMGEGPVLGRMFMPDHEPIDEPIRKESLDRAKEYIPALSDIHDNRAAPRDSRLVQKLLAHYLSVLIEDPRQSTLDTLLSGYDDPEIQRSNSGLSARQIAEALDRSRLWATLGWRRGQAERRFRVGPRGTYMENISGDVRILFEPGTNFAGFSDVRRLRRIDLATIRANPHPCDDLVVAGWIADNCAAARQALSRPG